MIILPFTSKDIAKKVAENLRVSIKAINFTNIKDKKITISIGVSEILKDKTIEEALNVADNLLYKAKQNGRDRVEVS